jgi:chemotaxis methyl-accepting protein methylase
MEQIARVRGFRCDVYRQGCLRRRLAVRMRARGAHTYHQYAVLLLRDPAEYDRLLAALTINVTKFYRNPETWQVLAATVIPRLWERGRGAVRCWSAGCASGEEPFTLAVLLLEQARRTAAASVTARIDATDYDLASLAKASQAAYPETALRDFPVALVRRYLMRDGPAVPLPEVRRLVHFGRQDITQEPPPHPPYDLILCRNQVAAEG